MQPAYYEDFTEIKKKIWSMLDDAVTNRSSQFRIPTFICGHNDDIENEWGEDLDNWEMIVNKEDCLWYDDSRSINLTMLSIC